MTSGGSTALHLAARKGKDAVATQLVNANANVNAVDNNNGDTPLHDAAFYGHAIVADLLLGAGANLKAANKSGETPAQYAKQLGHPELGRASSPSRVPRCLYVSAWGGAAAVALQRRGSRRPKGGVQPVGFGATFILLSLWCIFVLFNGFGVRQR